MSGRNFRTPLGVMTVIAAAALASGCSSSGSGTSTTAAVGGSSQSAVAATSSPSASAAVSASTQGQSNADGSSATDDAGGTVLSGTALLNKLKAVKPSGYTVETSDERSSGATPTAPSYGHSMSQCSALTDANAGTVTVDYQASWAITDAYNNSTHAEEFVSYSSYRPGDAVKQMAEIEQLAEKCSTYQQPTETGGSVTNKVQLMLPTEYGDQEVDVRVSSTVKGQNGNELLLIRMGNEIIALSYGPFPGATIELSDLAHPYVLGS